MTTNYTRKWVSVFLSTSIIFSSILSPILAQQKTINVAMLDLEGKGVSAMEASTLTDRLRSELVSAGKFQVVERGQMESLLEEQGFQQMGCTSAECAVEVGRLLGVEKMIAGSIGKLGTLYTLDTRMFDVSTSKIEVVSKREYQGDVEGLIKMLTVIAKDLSGIPVSDEELKKYSAAYASAANQAKESVAPKKKGRWLVWAGLLSAAGGGAYYFSMTKESKPLPTPPNPPE